jgi:penicillin-binding protein 1B
LPLIAVSGVVDAHGQTIKRYEVKPGKGEYQAATRLITWAMQQVVTSGTAAAIGSSNLAFLHAAGKTGTSDSQRDSWFAGFTGEHLAVVWMGRDDNKPTGLYGATGSMRVWQELFRKLPTRPRSAAPGDGLEMALVNPQTGKRTEAQCDGSRQIPFATGYLPQDEEGCFFQRLEGIFGVGGGKAPAPASSTISD